MLLHKDKFGVLRRCVNPKTCKSGGPVARTLSRTGAKNGVVEDAEWAHLPIGTTGEGCCYRMLIESNLEHPDQIPSNEGKKPTGRVLAEDAPPLVLVGLPAREGRVAASKVVSELEQAMPDGGFVVRRKPSEGKKKAHVRRVLAQRAVYHAAQREVWLVKLVEAFEELGARDEESQQWVLNRFVDRYADEVDATKPQDVQDYAAWKLSDSVRKEAFARCSAVLAS